MNTVNAESEKNKILCMMEELVAVEKRKDIEAVLDVMADDFVMIHGAFKVDEGMPALRELVKGALKNFINAKHFPLRVEVSSSGDMAWLLAYGISKSEGQEGIVEAKVPYMIAFRKVDGEWKWAAACEGQRVKV